MLKTNEKRLVEFLLQCSPGYPKAFGNEVSHEGKVFNLPSIGGITLNIQTGDTAFGWQGDHIEPGVSCTGNTKKPYEYPNPAIQIFSCVGNEVKIVSGKAKGEKGIVCGHHGGSEHIIVDFSKSTKEKLSYDDDIMIKAKGQGLKLEDYPEIVLLNMDPKLLKKMNIKELGKGRLEIPVTTIIPAACMGSGLGSDNMSSGDYDVMTSDPKTVKKYKLDKMRFGDFVAIKDHDNSYGPAYWQGAWSIGVVVHSDCFLAGHGPGVSILMTCKKSLIKPVLHKDANLSRLKIGVWNVKNK